MSQEALMSQEAFFYAFEDTEVKKYIRNHPENKPRLLILSIIGSMVDVGLIDK
jgi:hypothetical protein